MVVSEVPFFDSPQGHEKQDAAACSSERRSGTMNHTKRGFVLFL